MIKYSYADVKLVLSELTHETFKSSCQNIHIGQLTFFIELLLDNPAFGQVIPNIVLIFLT